MGKANTPYTIRIMLQQMGTGLYGALAYTGAHNLTYMHPKDCRDCECRPSFPSHVTSEGRIMADVALIFNVNGKPRQSWAMFVTYEADDTYTVRLWAKTDKKEQQEGKILDSATDVYWDSLQGTVERMYDNAITKHNGGFIPL